MATVYSLICFGGRTGKVVTFTVSGSVVNLTRHGLQDGTAIVFSSTTSLPTGLTAGAAYYSKLGADSSKFTLWTDATLTTQVTFTTTGSGTHTVKANYFVSLTAAQLLRYGDVGSEAIYDSMSAWNTARASASGLDVDYLEIGMAWDDDLNTSALSITTTSASAAIYPINSSGHNGVVGAGYRLISSANISSSGMLILSALVYAKGFTVVCRGANGAGGQLSYPGATFDSMMFIGSGTGTNNFGMRTAFSATIFTGCLSKGWAYGASVISANLYATAYYQNTIASNLIGVHTTQVSAVRGYFFNNLVIGNTTNWSAQPTGIQGASNNTGLSGDTPWGSSPVAIGSDWDSTAPLFMDYANSDFRPYASAGVLSANSALVVDGAVAYFGYENNPYDIAGDERPNYNNGGAEAYDIGAYEFDHGFGPHPASHTLTLTNVVVGSRILIRDQANTTTHYSADAASSTVVVVVTVYGDSRDDWDIKVRKGSAAPFYQPYRTQMTASAGASSIYVSQIEDQ